MKLYKQHKAEVETTLRRIDVWKEILRRGELEYFEDIPDKVPGMPRSKTVISPVENRIIRNEITTEMVEQWISDDESRIFYKKMEIEHIDIALQSLTAEKRFVIISKYFEDMTWRNIEIQFNEKFSRNRIYISDNRLRQMNGEILDILWEILGPLYSKYQYFKQYNFELKQQIKKQQEEQSKRRTDRK